MKELTNVLAPRINGLKSTINCVADFHDHTLLYSITLSSALVDTIIQCIPVLVRPTFLPTLEAFKAADISNQKPPAIFNFLSTFISSTAKTYLNYPLDFDDDISVTNIATKQVRLNNSNKRDNHFKYPAKKHGKRYCSLCSHKGFEDQH